MSVLREAFVDELRDLLDAENQLLKALPKLARAAENEQLCAAFREHESQTAQQINRLYKVFEAFEESVRVKRCQGMQGLLKEADVLIRKHEGDAALIAGAQKAEHYEIAAYGTLASWAVALGHDDVLQTLKDILEEEKAADKKLTMIAQSVVNSQESQRESEAKPRSRTTARRGRKRMAAARRTARARQRGRQTNQNTRSPRSKRLLSSAAR